jgi:hypothetical protein
VSGFALSLDGYGAGPRQSLAPPFGEGGEPLHRSFYPTWTLKLMHNGRDRGPTGMEDEFGHHPSYNR